MKCTLCGSEIGAGDQICKNCGTRVLEMNAGGSVRGENQSSFSAENRSSGNFKQNGSSLSLTSSDTVYSNKNSISMLRFVITMILVVVLGVGVIVYRSYATKVIETDFFSAKIPVTMSERYGALNSSLQSDDIKGSGKSYSYKNEVFGYVTYDLSSLGETKSSMFTEDEFLEVIEALMASSDENNGYEKISLKDNRLECYMQGENGKEYYYKILCKKRGAKLTLFVTACLKSSKDKTAPKMEKWLDSIIIK